MTSIMSGRATSRRTKVRDSVTTTDRGDYYALHDAINDKKPHEVHRLLAQGADVNASDSNGQTPVIRAVSAGDRHILSLLIEYQADLDAPDKVYGMTPLMHATYHGNDEMVNFLCMQGANVSIRNANNGKSLLHYAVENSDVTTLKRLMQFVIEPDVNCVDNKGMSPLMYAAKMGESEMAALLCRHHAKVNVSNCLDGKTALHYAVEDGHKKVVKELLKYDACVNIVDKKHKTPLELCDSESVRRILIDAGAFEFVYGASCCWSNSRRGSDVSTWTSVSQRPGSGQSDQRSMFRSQRYLIKSLEKIVENESTLNELSIKLEFEEESTVEFDCDTKVVHEPLPAPNPPELTREATPDDLVIDRVGFTEYLKQCAEHYLNHWTDPRARYQLCADADSERNDVQETCDLPGGIRFINHITQHITVHIGQATYVQTGENGRIVIKDRETDSVVSDSVVSDNFISRTDANDPDDV
ncbi:poly [ADP-ribose] polymerase tankyrase-like [Physella acuta]|uniref:poly [ADP-ribose] polymerase tankyrase-like n=1 Tax=Physella acuta TaxID=109671 RepID=UPI0027DE2C02|nr:poly [ADP-ribose] polymerase tankyrase-like [Physella acuta]